MLVRRVAETPTLSAKPIFELQAFDATVSPFTNQAFGLYLPVAADKADAALALLRGRGEEASVVGEIRKGDRGCVVI